MIAAFFDPPQFRCQQQVRLSEFRQKVTIEKINP